MFKFNLFFLNFRAEALAAEIRDLQGELGDYNTVRIFSISLLWLKGTIYGYNFYIS